MKYYISVTGLILNSVLRYPQFLYHAIPCFMQAQNTPGNIFADTKDVGSVHHTLTVWENRTAMGKFYSSDVHIKAMKSFDSFATGSVYGYESDEIPTWDEALALWKEKGRSVGNKSRNKDKTDLKIKGEGETVIQVGTTP